MGKKMPKGRDLKKAKAKAQTQLKARNTRIMKEEKYGREPTDGAPAGFSLAHI